MHNNTDGQHQDSSTAYSSPESSSPPPASPFLAFFLLTRPGLKSYTRVRQTFAIFLSLSPAASEGRLEAEVDVLLRVEPDNEGGDVDHLLPHSDVSLPNENPRVGNGLGQPELEHLTTQHSLHWGRQTSDLSLKSSLHEILGLQSEDVVKLHLVLGEDSSPDQSAKESISFKQSLGVLLLQGEQLPGGGPDLGQGVLHSPHLTAHSQLNVRTHVGISVSPLSCSSDQTLPPASVPDLVGPSRTVSEEWRKSSHTSWESSC